MLSPTVEARPDVTVDDIRTLLTGPGRALTATTVAGRDAVLVVLHYDTSIAASDDGKRIEASLVGAGYTDFDDPTDVVAHGGGKYTLEFEVRQ